MQKKMRITLKLLGLSLFVTVCVFLSSRPTFLYTPILPPEAPASIGDREDPEARFEYEWKRLRNPKTGKIPDRIRQKELAFAGNLHTVESLRKAAGQERALVYSWSPRGPYNVGGRTRALGMDITNESILLAGGVSGGMFRSTNGGATWTNTTDPSALHSISCLVQDTRTGKTNIWYYGSGEGIGNSASGSGAYFGGNGVFKSTDNGLTWFNLPSTATGDPHITWANDIIWDIAIDSSNLIKDEVYYCYIGVVRRSTNGGTSWDAVLGGSNWPYYSYYIDIAITSAGVLYATLSKFAWDGSYNATDAGLYRSTDGINWTNITPTGWPTDYRRIVIGIAPSNENVVYFLAETPGTGFHVQNDYYDEWTSFYKYAYGSGDGSGAGGTWEDRSANLPAFGGNVGSFVSQNGYDLIVKVKPDNENVVFIGGTNLYRSTDGFATNQNTTWIGGYSTANNLSIYQNHYCDQHAMVFQPSNPNVLFTGNDGGVQKSTDNMASNVAWTSLNNGYITTQYYTIAIDRATNGSNVVFGGMQDNGTYMTTSTNPNTLWNDAMGGDGSYCAVANGGSSVYVSSQNGNVYRFVYNASWNLQQWIKVDPTGGANYLFINPFTLDPNNTSMMYLAGGDRVWRNSDLTGIPYDYNNPASVNWTELTNTTVSNATISALGVSKLPANRLYYGTDDGQVYRLDGANSGNPTPADVWTSKSFPYNAYVSCIMVDPTNADKVMVVFSNYEVQSLFYTTNGGTSWTNVSGNLEQNPDGSGNGPSCRWASIVVTAAGPVTFVGTSTGLYSTSNLNETSTEWAQEGKTVIGNVVVDMMDTRQSDGLVVAATHGKGVFSANFTETVIEIADTTVFRGATVEIPVKMQGLGVADSVLAYQLKVGFDADVLLAVGAENGGTMTERWVSTLATPRETEMTVGGFTTNTSTTQLVPDAGILVKLKFIAHGIPSSQTSNSTIVRFLEATIYTLTKTIVVSHTKSGAVTVTTNPVHTVRNIQLYPGWNLISTSIAPEPNSIPQIFGALSVEYAMGYLAGQGPRTWVLNRPINDLVMMDGLHGYWIKSNASQITAWSVPGDSIAITTPILLYSGWNLIAYLPVKSDSIHHAFQTLDTLYSYVQGFEGGVGPKTWYRGRPLNDLLILRPLSGYWVKMTDARYLVYPTGGYLVPKWAHMDIVHEAVEDSFPIATHLWCDFWSDQPNVLNPGDTIHVFDGAGVFCGDTVVTAEGRFLVHVFGDDPLTPEVDEGAVEGDTLQFLVNGDSAMVVSGSDIWQYRGSKQVVLSLNPRRVNENDHDNGTPDGFSLRQNYPNPFNGQTIIPYDVRSDCRLSLVIFDATGRVVRTLVDGRFHRAGPYSAVWDGRDDGGERVSSGVYLCQLRTGAEKRHRKVVLVY